MQEARKHSFYSTILEQDYTIFAVESPSEYVQDTFHSKFHLNEPSHYAIKKPTFKLVLFFVFFILMLFFVCTL